jgi:aminoglycoside phosphotransferase
MTAGSPLDSAMEWAARRFGPVTFVADHSWSHGETCVVRVASAAGPLIVKAFRKRAHFERESDGYRFAAPLLGDAVPRLLASDADALVLALGIVPGDLALAAHELDPETHARAAQLLRRLHDGAPAVTDDMLGARMRASFESYAARSAGLIDLGDLAQVRALLAAIEGQPIAVVHCHGDFSPRNWLVDAGGTVRLIDFARFQRDHFLMDVLLMSRRYWPAHPELRDAFFSGYGRTPDARDSAYFRAAMGRWAVGTIIWSREHADAPFERLGRDALADLLYLPPP